MKVHHTDQTPYSSGVASPSPVKSEGESFAAQMDKQFLSSAQVAGERLPPPPASPHAGRIVTPAVAKQEALSAYKRQAESKPALTSLQKYADDQLLRSPGGDHYNLKEKKVEPKEAQSFVARIGKDLADAVGNGVNLFSNLLMGAKFCYRDANGEIQEARKKGLVGSVVDFFKDLGSALSFGAWRPDGDPEPVGLGKRCAFFFSKLFKSVTTDLLQNIPGSVNHMAEDAALTVWNLAEVLPDATIGNLPAGEKLTTKVFDGSQVLLNYTADIAPGGEAWQRVHAMSLREMKPPILNNLQKPERSSEDTRWSYIRNTPFRKAIETIGSLASDVLTFNFIKWINSSNDKTHRPY